MLRRSVSMFMLTISALVPTTRVSRGQQLGESERWQQMLTDPSGSYRAFAAMELAKLGSAAEPAP